MNGAQIILEMLRLYDVKHVFGLPGETTIDLSDHWGEYPDIEYILTRDEKNSAFMAEAYAKVTGKPGVIDTPSPGVTHSTPGIAEAFTGRNIADPASLEQALDILLTSRNPLIICGQGALSSGANPSVLNSAKKPAI